MLAFKKIESSDLEPLMLVVSIHTYNVAWFRSPCIRFSSQACNQSVTCPTTCGCGYTSIRRTSFIRHILPFHLLLWAHVLVDQSLRYVIVHVCWQFCILSGHYPCSNRVLPQCAILVSLWLPEVKEREERGEVGKEACSCIVLCREDLRVVLQNLVDFPPKSECVMFTKLCSM